MAEIIKFRKTAAKKHHAGNSLCRSNHHKWQILHDRHFDTRQGRLITTWQCQRCGKTRNRAI